VAKKINKKNTFKLLGKLSSIDVPTLITTVAFAGVTVGNYFIDKRAKNAESKLQEVYERLQEFEVALEEIDDAKREAEDFLKKQKAQKN